MNQKLFIFTIILLLMSHANAAQELYKETPAFYSYIIADTKTNPIYIKHMPLQDIRAVK